MGIFNNLFGGASEPQPSAEVTTLRNSAGWEGTGFHGQTLSGETVSESTAMTLSHYFDGLRIISEDLAKLRVQVFENTPDGKRLIPDHPVARLLSIAPNPEMGAMSFKETVHHFAMSGGNGYAIIRFKGNGEPGRIDPIISSRVLPKRKDGQLFYQISPGFNTVEKKSTNRTIPARNIIHIHGLGSNGLIGYSVIQFAAESLGSGLAQQAFSASFFANGAHIGGVLEHPGRLSEEARTNIRNSYDTVHRGARNANKMAILEEGLKYVAFKGNPKDSDLTNQRRFNILEVSRWFRIPPHKLASMERATFSNIVEENLSYVTDTMTPWFKRWEQEIKRKLLNRPGEENLEAVIDDAELLRGDPKTRSEFYKSQFNIGAMSPNEIRAAENRNLNPDDSANQYYIQMNMTTLSNVATGNNLKSNGNGGDNSLSGEAKETLNNFIAAQKPMFLDAAARILRKESMAISKAYKRFNDDKAEFSKWAVDFYQNQAGYLTSNFQAPVDSILQLAGSLLTDTKILEIDVKGWADDICQTATMLIIDAFDLDKIEKTLDDWENFLKVSMVNEIIGIIQDYVDSI